MFSNTIPPSKLIIHTTVMGLHDICVQQMGVKCHYSHHVGLAELNAKTVYSCQNNQISTILDMR